MESREEEITTIGVTYVENSANDRRFWDLWNLASEKTDHIGGKAMVLLLDSDIPCNKGYFDPCTIINRDEKDGRIYIIGVSSEVIMRHIIGNDPAAWLESAELGDIEPMRGTGPIHIIDDKTLLEQGVLNLADGIVNPEIMTSSAISERYAHIIRTIMKRELKLGDIIRIPVYDDFNHHTDLIEYRIYIWNGKKLSLPKQLEDGWLPTSKCTFPKFPLEHFSPLGPNGKFIGGFRWISGKVINKYNNTEIIRSREESYLKKVKVDGNEYYFIGKKEFLWPEVKMVAMIILLSESFNLDKEDSDTIAFEFY